MKRFVILLFASFVIFASCKKNNQNQDSDQSQPQQQTQTEDYLKGKITRTDFLNPPYNQWFSENYQNYEVDTNTLKNLNKDQFLNSNIVIVLGTWCSDSRREVPRFYKILDVLNYTKDIEMIAVPKPFKDYDLIKNYNIERIPTFIFYNQGQEIGRIVEKPQTSLEQDLVNIFSK